MDNNYIELKFDKLVTNLAGNKLGRATYKKQVKDKFEFNKKNIIVLDDAIEDVAISFFQGIFHEIVERNGRNEAMKIVGIKSIHQDIVDKFKKTMTI